MNIKDICTKNKHLPVHQLNKINEQGTERQNIFPISLVQAIYDKTGIRLDAIISSFNYLFLPWKGTKESTRLQVSGLMRRKSLVICYRDLDDNIIIEMYISNDRGDIEWQKDSNWKDFANWIKEVVENIFDNISNFPDIVNVIKEAVDNWLTITIGDKIEQIVNEYMESVDLNAIVSDSVSKWLTENTEIINNMINEYLENNLEPIIGEFFTNIVKYIQDNERVIANSLARHEQAITDLQNS